MTGWPKTFFVILYAFVGSACSEKVFRSANAQRVDNVAVAPSGGNPLPSSTGPRPDIVIVTIDTLRADVLGYAGGPANTPHLDRLAASAHVFMNAVSASTLTNPAHASLFTGVYPRDHGVFDNESGIPDGFLTLATALQRVGYETGAVVGFPHLNPETSNLGQGFSHWVRADRQHERRADETTRAGLALWDKLGKAGRPRFLWLHYVDPHAPYEPSSGYERTVDEHAAQTPLAHIVGRAPGFQRNNPWFKKWFASNESVEDGRERYRLEVEATDRGIGALLAGLQASASPSKLVLVITADHGENLGEHDLYFHHGGLYDAAARVPLIIAGPGVSPLRDDTLVSSIDVAPTILRLAGLKPEPKMKGRVIAGPTGTLRTGPVYTEHMYGQLLSVRTNKAMAIIHRKSSRQFPSYPFRTGHKEIGLWVDGHWRVDQDVRLSDAERAELDEYIRHYLQTKQTAPKSAEFVDRASLEALGYVEP